MSRTHPFNVIDGARRIETPSQASGTAISQIDATKGMRCFLGILI
ncbi:hypothetical protein Z945_540 [Sulfitobacter noctilucae]|nr:hypothetical protein Z945_540 [Sulfitobacter noctilucae]